jgi:hypothetical protein
VLLCRSYAQLSLGLNGFRLIREPIREVDLDTQLCVSSQVHGSMLFGFWPSRAIKEIRTMDIEDSRHPSRVQLHHRIFCPVMERILFRKRLLAYSQHSSSNLCCAYGVVLFISKLYMYIGEIHTLPTCPQRQQGLLQIAAFGLY